MLAQDVTFQPIFYNVTDRGYVLQKIIIKVKNFFKVVSWTAKWQMSVLVANTQMLVMVANCRLMVVLVKLNISIRTFIVVATNNTTTLQHDIESIGVDAFPPKGYLRLVDLYCCSRL